MALGLIILLGFGGALGFAMGWGGLAQKIGLALLFATPLLVTLAAADGSADEAEAALTATNPQGRLVQPGEVADTVQWLCGPGAGAVTGQALSVSGGEVM